MTPPSIALGLLLGLAALTSAYPDDEKPAENKTGAIVLVDSTGKEHKVTGYRITAGTRRLGWLTAEGSAPAKKAPKGTRPVAPIEGPEALVVRDDASIRFLEGVVTLVPLTQLRSVRFDGEKSTMTAIVAVSAKAEEDVTLSGTTKYKGINKITLEAEVDKGDAGVATLTFQGGVLKGGIRAMTFPVPKLDAPKAGRPGSVSISNINGKITIMIDGVPFNPEAMAPPPPPPAPPAGWVRAVRAVTLLEHLGTAEAQQLLQAIAAGEADALPTIAAREALERLKK